MTNGLDRSFFARLQAVAKPFYLLAFVLAAKLLVVRSLVFLSSDFLRFVVTDLSTALLVAAAVEGRRMGRRSTVIFVDVVFSTLMAVLLVFYAFYGRLPSLQALGFAEQLGAVKASVLSLLRPELFLLYVDVPLIGALAHLRPAFFERRVGKRVRGSFVLVGLLIAAADITLGVMRPIPDFTMAAEARGIANQEIADWLSREFVVRPQSVGIRDPRVLQARIEELRTGTPAGSSPSAVATGALAGTGKGRNVILIVSESLQRFLLDKSVAGQEVVPSLDALAAEGYTFDRVFTQVAAGNTSDCEFAVNTSLMPAENKPFVLEYGDRSIPSLPRLLKARGYRTMTFHPNVASFWYRDRLYPSLGFDAYYDAKFYGEEDVIGIGDSDDVIFQRALPVLAETAKSGKPFYAAFVTLTSHDPFDLPEDRRTLKLPADAARTRTGRYLISQHYADAAIGRFVEGLKKAGLYEDSVIVVIGDHFGLQPSAMTADDLRLASEVVGHEYGEVDRYNVPLIVAVPGARTSGVVHTVGGQVDVLPTLASVLDVPLDGFVHVGRDLMQPGPSLVGMRYYEPLGTYIDDRFLAIQAGSRAETWDVATGARTAGLPADSADKSKRMIEIAQLSDAYARTLPRR